MSEQKIDEGSPVIFEHQGKPYLGIVTSHSGKKFQVLNMHGGNASLTPNRLHPLPTLEFPALEKGEESVQLLSLFDRAEEASTSVSPEEIWSLLHEEQETFACSEICEQYLGKDNFHSHLSLYLALLRDRVYFKRKGSHFVPRAKSAVEEMQLSEKVREEREQLEKLFVDECKLRIRDGLDQPFPEAFEELIDILRKVAADVSHVSNTEHKAAQRITGLVEEECNVKLGNARERRAWKLLRRTGILHENFNPSFLRFSIRESYADGALAAAAAAEPARGAPVAPRGPALSSR